jgi:hypothetical protein
MINFNLPATNTVRQFDMSTGPARDIQTTVPTQNPPIRQVGHVTREEDAGLVAQREAQMREQARVEAERAALEASDEYSQAASWLRQRPQHRALIEIVVRLMKLEAA